MGHGLAINPFWLAVKGRPLAIRAICYLAGLAFVKGWDLPVSGAEKVPQQHCRLDGPSGSPILRRGDFFAGPGAFD
jgi:hypothetical protein